MNRILFSAFHANAEYNRVLLRVSTRPNPIGKDIGERIASSTDGGLSGILVFDLNV